MNVSDDDDIVSEALNSNCHAVANSTIISPTSSASLGCSKSTRISSSGASSSQPETSSKQIGPSSSKASASSSSVVSSKPVSSSSSSFNDYDSNSSRVSSHRSQFSHYSIQLDGFVRIEQYNKLEDRLKELSDQLNLLFTTNVKRFEYNGNYLNY